MSERLNLTLFAHVCARPEAELDLAEATLLIAEAEYPGLEVARYIGALDELGRGALASVARNTFPGLAAPADETRISQTLGYLYEDARFHGNEEDYYDPRNSFLSDVIDRRTGIPITLAVVLTEVCRRAGLAARGVSFPGHFLVRIDAPRGVLFVDPFTGRLLRRDELRALYARATGDDRDPPARVLQAATKVQILTRILTNLRSIYENRHDDARLLGVLERVQVLAPSEALRQRIEELGGNAPWRSDRGGVN